jgi:hypothetical protein
MNHIPYTLICLIADGDTLNVGPEHFSHLGTCKKCRAEVDLQKRIISISRASATVLPSSKFTRNVMEAVNPNKKKHWWENVVQNMGNVIAMGSVLALLLYVFSVASKFGIQVDKPTDSTIAKDLLTILDKCSHQIVILLSPKPIPRLAFQHNPNVVLFAILAVIILLFFDKILKSIFHRS